MSELPPPGWYLDPEQVQTQRYWDGEAWTDQRAPAALATSRSNTVALVGLIAGILGAMVGLGPAINYPIPLALGAVAIVLGIMGRRRPGGRGMGTWAIVLGLVALALGIAGAVAVEQAVDDLEEAFNSS